MAEDSSDLSTEVIKHLSSEIEKQSDFLLALRSRMAYTVMIGPFFVVGSFLVAMKDKALHHGQTHPRMTILAVIAALSSYVALAIYGAMLDRHTTMQSNRWRDEIALLANGGEISKHRLQFTEYQPFWAYLSAFTIVVVAFSSIVFIATQFLT